MWAWLRRRWRTVLGFIVFLPTLVRLANTVVGWGGSADFLITRSQDPGWVGRVLTWLLDPVGQLALIVSGLGLIWWDSHRLRLAPAQLSIRPALKPPALRFGDRTIVGLWYGPRFVLSEPTYIKMKLPRGGFCIIILNRHYGQYPKNSMIELRLISPAEPCLFVQDDHDGNAIANTQKKIAPGDTFNLDTRISPRFRMYIELDPNSQGTTEVSLQIVSAWMAKLD